MDSQERVMGLLSQVAKENGVTLETVIMEIEKIIQNGLHSKDAQVRKRWQRIPRKGDAPTVAELISYCAAIAGQRSME